MSRFASRAACALLAVLSVTAPAFAVAAPKAPVAHGQYRNFRAAIYIPVNVTKTLADPKVFEHQFARAISQVPFDKVYIEAYRDRSFATDAELDTVKKEFQAKGIQVAGGVTLAAGGFNGQFGTFDYENPADRAECTKAIEMAARHFDEVILDDFFFYTSKSDADIAAKGDRTWTQYRIDTMRKVSKDLVLDPAHAANPKVRVIIKYPNWYEHFQGLGFDLDKQPEMFDGLYTGTETRDPVVTDQLLQQYESYEIIRYYKSLRADHYNGGGWVDTYSTLYADRYAEQLWDTLFAKAPEITLFNWHPVALDTPIEAGDRKWAAQDTSFNWERIAADYKGSAPAGWGLAAGAALKQADDVLGLLGNPIGVASYKPAGSSGEDFLHNYLGNMGVPIELSAHFPADADTVLLTQAAAADPDIIADIKTQLQAGKTVFVTSGFVKATQDATRKGGSFEDLLEVYATGQPVAVNDYFNGYGAGNGQSLRDDPKVAPKDILIPELHYYTNDAWPIIRGVSGGRGFPILLSNRYSKGQLFVLTVPDNIGDLYSMPQGVMTNVKKYLQAGAPVRIDAPASVSLFTYDNGAFIVESFNDAPVTVTVSLRAGTHDLKMVVNGKTTTVATRPEVASGANAADPRATFNLTIPAHSFRVFITSGSHG